MINNKNEIDPNKKIPPITELIQYKNGTKKIILTIIQQV